ncbi:hypothetical protein ACQP1P_22015 [Dactylosporangium sp. CA-052675]|uniref:hypothetical protein n=1 Tax=Dactylosporangium sp. CA-052675 TaxID=3239927 RepID=UPI003D943F75
MFAVAQPDEDILAEVAAAAGPWLGSLLEDERRQAVAELDEAYPCWVLGTDAVHAAAQLTSDDDALARVAQDLGQWHYQILLDGEPAAFARAYGRVLPETPVEVGVVGYSDVAKDVADCVAWAREHAPDGAQVRLLLAPPWHVTALWLSYPDGSRVVVARSPEPVRGLSPRTLHAGADFLRALASTAPSRR